MKTITILLLLTLQYHVFADTTKREADSPKGWPKMSLEYQDNGSDYALMATFLNEMMTTTNDQKAPRTLLAFLDEKDSSELKRLERVSALWAMKARAKYWEPFDLFWEKSVKTSYNKYPKDKSKRSSYLINNYNSRTYPFYFAFFHSNFHEISKMIISQP